MRRWNRRERERAARKLMWFAFVEIRYLARGPKGTEDPAAALERIGWLADACHNLPGVAGRRPSRWGDTDPFIGPWKSSRPGQHAWMAGVLKSAGLDTAWLDAAPLWYPPIDPVERPRLARGGVRFPRGLREYAELDTEALRALLTDAWEHGARKVGTGPMLTHAAPDGRHLLRAVRRGELRFDTEHEGLDEYRCLVQMNDGVVAVDRYWLRPAVLAEVTRGLSLARRLWLSASVPQRHERDMYLWHRAHKENSPDCLICDDITDHRQPQPQKGSDD